MMSTESVLDVLCERLKVESSEGIELLRNFEDNPICSLKSIKACVA